MEGIESTNKPEFTVPRLAASTVETVKLCKSEGVNPTAGFVIVAMKSAFPDRFSNAALKQNDNANFLGAMIWVGVEVNDAVDMIPHSREMGNQQKVEEIFKSWKRALRNAEPFTDESSFRQQLLRDYQREILFCEKKAREFEDPLKESVIQYRELMNAISVVNNAAALFGEGELSSHTKTIGKENLTWEALLNKYSWIMEGRFENETEEKLCGLFNLVMAIQVVDDKQDITDDTTLGLHTLATSVEDPNQLIAEYLKKTEKYGFTPSAGEASKLAFLLMKKIQRKWPNIFGGRRERLLSGTKEVLEQSL